MVLSPETLAEIREQHVPFEMPDGAILCDWCVDPWPCDAVALLAEVHRLTADQTPRLRAAFADGQDFGADRERARIRAGVEGLAEDDCGCCLVPTVPTEALLRVIDGGEA